MSLRTIYKIKKRRTYDTDKYEMHFRITEDRAEKSVWEADAYVGPESYNNSHIDRILESRNNRACDIMDQGYNPRFINRSLQSQERAKFTP